MFLAKKAIQHPHSPGILVPSFTAFDTMRNPQLTIGLLLLLLGCAPVFADTAYVSLVHPMWKTHYGDYDHLARVKEWSLSGGADDGGGE